MTNHPKFTESQDSAARKSSSRTSTGSRKDKCADCGNDADDQCENCLAHICDEHTNYGKYEDAFVCQDEDKCEERCEALLKR